MLKTDSKTLRMTIAALFVAVLIVMDVIPQVGFFQYGAISITFLIIPVAVGAYLLGAGWGALFGLVFGLASLLRCFAIPYPDAFGAAVWAINPAGCAAMCLIPRMLMGFCCGLIGDLARKDPDAKGFKDIMPMIICSLAGALLNTVFFVTAFILIYRNADLSALQIGLLSEKSIKEIILIFVSINALVELAVCGILGTILCKALKPVFKKADIYE